MMRALAKALEDAFDLHEQHRALTRRAREKHQEARKADERVRVLKGYASESDHQHSKKGRAA